MLFSLKLIHAVLTIELGCKRLICMKVGISGVHGEYTNIIVLHLIIGLSRNSYTNWLFQQT